MAPVPYALDPTLTARLTALTEAQTLTRSLIAQLSRYSPHDPSSTGLNIADLSSEIHESLKEQEEALDLLSQDLADLPLSASNGASNPALRKVLTTVSRLEEDIKLSRSAFRRAQLQAKRNSLRPSNSSARNALFAGARPDSPSRRPGERRKKAGLTQEQLTAHASSDVLVALRRTHKLMEGNLSQSEFANEALAQQTAAMQSLGMKYTDLDDMLAKSRGLVGVLIRSNKSDTWYLTSTMYILGALLVWIVYRRLLYGPLWWFVYLPLKIAWWTFATLFSLMGITGRQAPPPLKEAIMAEEGLVSGKIYPTWTGGVVKPTIMGGEGLRVEVQPDVPVKSRPPNEKKREWVEEGAEGHDEKDEL